MSLRLCCSILLSVLATIFLQTTPAFARYYEDKFATLKQDYTSNTKISVKDGMLLLPAPTNRGFKAINGSLLFDDMDATVSLALIDEQKPDKSDPAVGGMIFWATNDQNYYVFQVSDNGSAGVARVINTSRFLNPVAWKTLPAVKVGLNQWNVLRVVTKASHATCYVNDTVVGEFDGQLPDGGGQIGFYSGGESGGPITYAFKDLSIKY